MIRDLREGENVLVAAEEPGSAGDAWIITTLAVYIFAKPTRSNRKSGHQGSLRIPRSHVIEVREVPLEAETALSLTVEDEGEVLGDLTGTFRSGDAAVLARALRPEEQIPSS